MSLPRSVQIPQVAVSNRSAITLVELVVVLVVLGLTSALVAPALIFPPSEAPDPYGRVLDGVVKLAATREQVIRLVVADDGSWRVEAPGEPTPVADGRFQDYAAPAFALDVSPLGTCGARPGSAPPFPLDPLTCTIP